MLSCREMSERASEVVDGRASWRVKMAAQLHTMMCEHCRRYYRQLRVTISVVQRMGRPHPAVDTARVLKAIESHDRGRPGDR